MVQTAIFIILLFITGALGLAWVYFHRYQMPRPPIGLINLWDVALMLVGIVFVPYVYLALPLWLVVALIGLAFMSIISLMLEPLVKARWLIWLVTLALLGADIGAAWQWGATSASFFVVNDLVLV